MDFDRNNLLAPRLNPPKLLISKLAIERGETGLNMTQSNPNKLPTWFKKAGELALQEWTRNFDFYRDSVYLTNPSVQKKIDRFIRKIIWPAAISALEPTHFRVLNESNLKTEDGCGVNTCRSVQIVVEDPACPLASRMFSPWYCRLGLVCDARNYVTFNKFLQVSPPLDCDWRLLFDLLIDTSDHGIPSKLFVTRDDNEYTIAFEAGGTGELSHLPIQEHIKMQLLAYCDFIEAVTELERNWQDPLLLRKLIREVNRALEI